MNIKRLTTIEEALTLIPWEHEIQQKGRVSCPIQRLLVTIRDHIDNPMFIILFAHDKGKPLGFCISIISKKDKLIYILRMYGSGLVEHFLNELIQLGKGYHVNKFFFTVENGMKAIERKYGFKQVSVNMDGEGGLR